MTEDAVMLRKTGICWVTVIFAITMAVASLSCSDTPVDVDQTPAAVQVATPTASTLDAAIPASTPVAADTPSPVPPTPTVTEVAATATPEPTATPELTPTPEPPPATPEPTPTPEPIQFVVGNTDGEGVWIRTTITAEDRVKVWPEGSLMVGSGHTQEVDGAIWHNVTDPDGTEGWIPAEFLVTPTATPLPTPTIDISRYKLELLTMRARRASGFVIVEGQVKNISNASLEDVQVTVEHYDSERNLVASSSATIEYNPILASQTSSFEVATDDDSAMVRVSISFKDRSDATIPTLDSRDR